MKRKFNWHRTLPVKLILSLVFLFLFSGFTLAQSQGIEITSGPQIFAESLVVSQIDEKSGKINGSFSIINKEEKNYYDVYFIIYLYQIIQKGLSNEENQYDLSNWDLVASYPDVQPIMIKAGERKEKNFSIDLPRNRPMGNYLLKAQVFLKEGSETGSSISSTFHLSGNNYFYKLGLLKVIKDNKEYPSGVGIDFSQDEKPIISVIAKNISDQGVEAAARVSIFKHSQFGEKIKEFQAEEMLNLPPGQQDFYKVELPLLNQAGSFLIQLQLFDRVNNFPVSAPVQFRYVIRGESGKILELIADKDNYKKGEYSRVEIKLVGSADSVVQNDKGIWVENPQREPFEANLEIEIRNFSGVIVGKKTLTVFLDSNARDYEVDIPIQEDAIGYVLKAGLDKDGKLLDEKLLNISSENETSSYPTLEVKQKQSFFIVKIVILLLIMAAVLTAIYFVLKKRRNRMPTFLLIFSFLSGGILFCNNCANAFTVYLHCSSPPDESRYITTSNSSDVILFSANPEIEGCSNQISSMGPAGFYINENLVSSGSSNIFNYSGSTVYLPYLKLGKNKVRLQVEVIDIEGFSRTFSDNRTIYVDTAKLSVGVYENTTGGLRIISGASVDCGGTLQGTTGSSRIEFFMVLPGTRTCTASKEGYETNSTSVNVDEVSKRADIILTPSAPPPPPGAPSCSLSFSPSSITSGQSSTATWSSQNDADGILEYSCTGDIGSGTMEASGSATVTPSQTSTCKITVRNSAGTTGTCQATITVGSTPPPTTGGYMCGIGYNCQACPALGSSACVYSSLSSCQSACQPPPPPTCECEFNPDTINKGEPTKIFWKQSGDYDGRLEFNIISGGYLGWKYQRDTALVSGHLTPRCICDNDSKTINCGNTITFNEGDPDTCYDQYERRTFSITTGRTTVPYSQAYNKTKLTDGVLDPSPVFKFQEFSALPVYNSRYSRFTSCACDITAENIDCPRPNFPDTGLSINSCYDHFMSGNRPMVLMYRKELIWNGWKELRPIPNSPVVFQITARNEGGRRTNRCTVNVNESPTPPPPPPPRVTYSCDNGNCTSKDCGKTVSWTCYKIDSE